MTFEQLEARQLLAVDWRNPINALDVTADGSTVPLDALNVINELNNNGSRRLADEKDPAKPFWDTTGDQFLSPLDALQVINALNGRNAAPYQLSEGETIDHQATATITLGQPAGTRTYRLQINPEFDESDTTAVIDDVFAVYLVNPSNHSQTLLDRGQPGTALFTLSPSGADFHPGPIRWDGSILELDLSTITDRDTGVLKLQLLGTDADTGTRVTVQPLSNEVGLERASGPTLPASSSAVTPGGETNLAGLTPASNVSLDVTNVRFDQSSGRLAADVTLRSDDPAALSRNIVVAFPGLPAGVTLHNASGTTADGAQYLNFQPAIPRGGLSRGLRSERLLVEFDDPARTRFTILPQVLAANNRAPQFSSVGPMTVMPGATLTVPLQATDPDGDTVTFSLSTADALPMGTLRGDGTLVFRPNPGQLGTYHFTLTASDGAAETQHDVTLDVVADPITTTRISGQVLDVDQTPLAGMQVEIGAVQGLTQSDGSFILDLGDGPLVSDTLKIRGESFSGPAVYPFIAEKLPLVLEHDVYTGVNNVIDRPIFLPKLDVASGRTIDPMEDTTITTDAIPGASVFVKAGTLMDQQGTPFTNVLSITAVPTDLTPAALPSNLIPDLVVTIQPGEMVFAAPAPLSLPNRSGWAPGTAMDLWSINPVTGVFDNVGVGQVSTDGQVVDTVGGGIRNSSWHFFSPRLRDPRDDSELLNCDVCAAAAPATSNVELHSGALHETHELVTYQSLGRWRGVVLHYDSLRAHPQPVVQFSYQIDGSVLANLNAPVGESRISAKLSVDVNGIQIELPGAPAGTVGLSGGEHFFKFDDLRASDLGKRLNAALPVVMDGLVTGSHPYQLNVGVLRISDGQAAGATTPLDGQLIVVDKSAGPFGAGWGIEGLWELIENRDGSVLMIDGNGSEMLFQPDTMSLGNFESPPGHFGSLQKTTTGFQHTAPDQMVSLFDLAGRLLSITDRNGNRDQYEHDSGGRLTSIVDPVGLATTFSYVNDRVSSITDPDGRVTQLDYDAAGNLIRVSDPDQTSRSWSYDADHRMTGEENQRGFSEQVSYDSFGRVASVTRADGSTMTFVLAQAQALYPPDRTIHPNDAPEARVGLAHEATIVDGNGEIERLELNAAGQVTAVFDRLGHRFSAEYDSDFQPIATTDGRGVRTTYEYDSRGNLVATRDVVPVNPTSQSRSVFALRQFASISQPAAMKAVDVNGDGLLDIMTAGILTVTLGHGDGIFDDLTVHPVQTSILAAAIDVEDFDADGKVDVVLVRNQLQILKGDGAGGFAVSQTLQTGAGPIAVIAGDLNGDGRFDFVTANSTANSATVLIDQGGGAFARVDLPAGTKPIDVELADMNLDGRPDVLVLNEESRDIIVFSNLGNGQFAAAVTYAATAALPGGTVPKPGDMEISDFNGDSRPDVATAHQLAPTGTGTISVLLNDGFGGLSPAIGYAGTSPAISKHVAAADLDQDGDQDLVVDHDGVFFNNGAGTFGSRVVRLTGRDYGRVIADVNRDGVIDIVYGTVDRAFTVNLGVGRGAFEESQAVASTGLNPVRTLTGDMNLDGIKDLVTLKFETVSVSLGLGNSSFGPASIFAGCNCLAGDGTLADFDNDGNLDLLSSGALYFGRGDGTLELPTDNFATDRGSAVADVDGDGRPDAVHLTSATSLAIRVNNGNRTFAAPINLDTGGVSTHLVMLGDVNGDTQIDIIALGSLDNNLAVLLGNGDRTFSAPLIQSSGSALRNGVLGDFNGDSQLDLGMIELTGSNSNPYRATVLFGNGDGTFMAPVAVTPNGGVSEITAADIDGDGFDDLALAFRNQMVLAYGDVAGGFTVATYEKPGSRSVNLEYAITVEDINGDGRNDLLVPSALTFSSPAIFAVLDAAAQPRLVESTTSFDATFSQSTQVTDELGHQIDFDLDPQNGNARKITQVVGSLGDEDDVISQFTYTSTGLIDLATDPLGVVTDYDYEARGRLITVTYAVGRPEQAVRRFEYDEAGNRTSVLDENGKQTQYSFDARGRLVRIRNPAQGDTTYDYDAAGNLIAEHDPAGHVQRYEYDGRNRRKTTIDAGDHLMRYAYDQEGNLVEDIDPLGHTSRAQFDARDRRVTETNSNGEVTQFRYDAADNLTTLVDPLGNRTLFEYDNRNRLIGQTDPLGQVVRYAYDASDRLVEKRDRNQLRTKYEYDVLDRLINETWFNADGSSQNVLEHEYDPAGNLVVTRDDLSQLAFTYDGRHRLLSVDNLGTTAAPQVAVSYDYDLGGNVTEVTDTVAGLVAGTTSYSYDLANRLVRLSQSGPDVADKRIDFEYNSVWQTSAIHRFSDLGGAQPVASTTFAYDQQNRITELRHSRGSTDPDTISFFQFSYDTASRITEIVDVDGTTDYSHDAFGQLTAAAHSDEDQPDEAYTYDADGNRETSHLHGDSYQSGQANRLSTDGVYNYTYDAEGNLILRTTIADNSTRGFVWDHRNRLVQIIDRNSANVIRQKVRFTYDPLNRRIAKFVESPTGSTTHYYVYDRDNVILTFVDPDGSAGNQPAAIAHRYLHGPSIDQVLAEEDESGEVLWHLADHLGTIHDLVTSDGLVANHAIFDAFGQLVAEQGSSPASTYQFTGREFDPETGLYYYRARYYDAATGRMLSEDTLGFAAGDFNLYRYTGNQPTGFRDPSGHQSQSIATDAFIEQFEGALRQQLIDDATLAQYLRDDGFRWYFDREAGRLFNEPVSLNEQLRAQFHRPPTRDELVGLLDNLVEDYSPYAGACAWRTLRGRRDKLGLTPSQLSGQVLGLLRDINRGLALAGLPPIDLSRAMEAHGPVFQQYGGEPLRGPLDDPFAIPQLLLSPFRPQ